MTTPTQAFHIHPIGCVRQGEAASVLEIDAPYRPALKELRQFSHVLVFWWADQADTPEARATLQADLPYARGTVAGVFACRSEYRPNPIALTACPILEVDEQAGQVVLAWIDAHDGSPLLDLKPYIPMVDRIRDVQVAAWFAGWPEWLEDAAEYFAAHPVDFGE